MRIKTVFVVFSLVFTFALATFDGSQSSDYEELQASPNSLSAPTLVKKAPPKAIYVSPDLEDIRDQQSYDVFHDVVRGAILMPKIKFSLRDDDDCIREADDDSEGRQLSPGEAGTADEDMGGAQTQTVGPPRPRMLRPTRKRRVPRPPVRVFPNPLFKRTIEEMIPYSKIPFSEDTYIVMADDPVLAVDGVPKCSAKAMENSSGGGGDAKTTEGGDSTTAAGDSTTAGDDDTTTEASRRRRKRALFARN